LSERRPAEGGKRRPNRTFHLALEGLEVRAIVRAVTVKKKNDGRSAFLRGKVRVTG